MGLPVLTSTPFQPMTSVSTPPLSSSETPVVIPTSIPSTGRLSLSSASSHETSKAIESQFVTSIEKSPSVQTSRQGSKVSTAITVNSSSDDHILKRVSTSSGLNQPSIVSHGSGDISLRTIQKVSTLLIFSTKIE